MIQRAVGKGMGKLAPRPPPCSIRFTAGTGGMTEQEILADFPALHAEHIKAMLALAAQRERQLAA
jgi:hypothetical protein